MLLTGHQPNYLPYLGFFHKIYHADLFVIVDNVQFVKRGPFGWVNRNKIRTQEGDSWLTVPVLVKGKFHQSIKDTKINTTLPWARKHWGTLAGNYSKAPYFAQYADFFDETYNKKKWESFCELSIHMILFLLKALGIQKPVKVSSEMGAQGKGDELILDMCDKTGSDAYLHGKHGQDYIDEEKFKQRKIQCVYQNFEHPVYRQQHSPFISHLSVVDLLFNHGGGSLEILLSKKKLSEEIL